MLLEEVLQRVHSAYSRGVQSKDTRLTSRHIYSATCTARNILLGQQVDRNYTISQWSYQPLPCIRLIKSSFIECNIKVPDGCSVLRSEYKIPKIISAKGKDMIQSISTLNGEIELYRTSFSTRKYASGNKYTAKSFRFLIYNGYIYITIAEELKAITMSAAWDSPVEAYLYPEFCNSESSVCKDIFEMEYPLDGDLILPMIQIATKELILLLKQMTEDRSNNASDDSSTSGDMVHDPNSQQQ